MWLSLRSTGKPRGYPLPPPALPRVPFDSCTVLIQVLSFLWKRLPAVVNSPTVPFSGIFLFHSFISYWHPTNGFPSLSRTPLLRLFMFQRAELWSVVAKCAGFLQVPLGSKEDHLIFFLIWSWFEWTSIIFPRARILDACCLFKRAARLVWDIAAVILKLSFGSYRFYCCFYLLSVLLNLI